MPKNRKIGEKLETMQELVNLTFNMHCYSLINNFSDLNKLGKDLYLTEKMAVATKELDELDGESYAMDVINNNKSARVTPYGVLYKNSNDPIQVYNGKQFPPYGWKESMATVELKAKNESEFIYLPSSDIEIEKALMRLGVSYLQDCKVNTDSHNLSDNVLEMIPENITSMERVDTLNNLAKKFMEMKGDIEYFERLMEYVNPRTIDEVVSLADSMYEFELFDGIKDAGRRIHQSCLLTVAFLGIPDMRPTTIYFINRVRASKTMVDIWFVNQEELEFLQDRFKEMSVREKYILEGAVELNKVNNAIDLINLTEQLYRFDYYHNVADEKSLGEYVAKYKEHARDEALMFINTEKLGREYHEDFQGEFTDRGYVIQRGIIEQIYDGSNIDEISKGDW